MLHKVFGYQDKVNKVMISLIVVGRNKNEKVVKEG